MDKPNVDNRLVKPKHLRIGIPVLIVLGLLLFMLFANTSSTYRVSRERVTISPVVKGPFDNYIRVSGTVAPIAVVSVEALEGGRVETIHVEEGATVKKGDVLLTLRNQQLNMGFSDRASSYAYLTNDLSNQLIEFKRQELTDKQTLLLLTNELNDDKRKLEKIQRLFEKGGASEEEYLSLKSKYETTEMNRALKLEIMALDTAFRANKRKQIELSMRMIGQQLDNLIVKAPADGQLTGFNPEMGQSVSKGQTIGQINDLTAYKLFAYFDEYYIDRIRTGQEATFERASATYTLKVTKVYPQVNDQQFRIELRFVAGIPDNIRSGQTFNLHLKLGETEEALLVERGAFFQKTGGQWIFVLSPDESFAVKRNVRIGRQNQAYYEILDGLQPGEKVITSSYDTFGDNDNIQFN